jgi:DNA polymerase III subunit gamma/tau
MSYVVLARKWRPMSFRDLIGQEHVSRTLANAIARERVAHAFLFTGVRGVGKTTSARILAKALNCLQPQTRAAEGADGGGVEPCLSCSACREIAEGIDVDVREIDGASYTGVDEIRKLQESLPYRPVRDRYKIFIVDEVHMLSQNAWNALLKTLEEPPPHIKFILATTEVHKVPVTILSRVQRFDFKMIPSRLIGERIRHVLAQEGIEADDSAVAIVAREAAGSMRDALSLLDQVIAFSPKQLVGDEVRRVLGVAGYVALTDIAEAVLRGAAGRALEGIAELSNQSCDLTVTARDLLGVLRDLTVAKLCKEPDTLLDLSDDERRRIKELAASFDEAELLRVQRGFAAGFDDLARSPEPRAALEMLLARLALRPALLPLDDLLQRLAELEARLGSGRPPPPPAGGGRPSPGAGGGPARGGPRPAASASGSDAPARASAEAPLAAGAGASSTRPAAASPAPADPRGAPAAVGAAVAAPAAAVAPTAVSTAAVAAPTAVSSAAVVAPTAVSSAAVSSAAVALAPVASSAAVASAGVALAPVASSAAVASAGMAPPLTSASVSPALVVAASAPAAAVPDVSAPVGASPARSVSQPAATGAPPSSNVRRLPADPSARRLEAVGPPASAAVALSARALPANDGAPPSSSGSPPAPPSAPAEEELAPPDAAAEARFAQLRRVLDLLGQSRQDLVAILKHTAPLEVSADALTLGYEPGNVLEAPMRSPECMAQLRDAAVSVFGREPKILLLPMETRVPTLAETDRRAREREKRAAVVRAERHPSVRDAVEILGARVKRIEIGDG